MMLRQLEIPTDVFVVRWTFLFSWEVSGVMRYLKEGKRTRLDDRWICFSYQEYRFSHTRSSMGQFHYLVPVEDVNCADFVNLSDYELMMKDLNVNEGITSVFRRKLVEVDNLDRVLYFVVL